MKNLQKGFIVPVLLVVIALLVIGGGVYVYVYENKKTEAPAVNVGTRQSNQQTNTQNSTPTTQSNSTRDWKTYTNPEYGFEVKYPSDWKVTDTSQIIAINNTKNTAVNIESPLRYDLSGYQGVPTSYRILIYLDSSSKIVSIADFGSPQLSHQSAWNVSIDEKVKEATNEYRIGQQIISSFKLIIAR